MSNRADRLLTWVEISKGAYQKNITTIRNAIGSRVLMAPAVKGNAYGHGMVQTAKIILGAGADWLSVNSFFEAEALRASGITSPIYILGFVMSSEVKSSVELDCRLVVYNTETIDQIANAVRYLKKKARVHIKVETGTNRQGVIPEQVVKFAKYIQSKKNIEIEGICTHFANLEDRINIDYAELQLHRFDDALERLEKAGINIPIKHCANSAATLLMPDTHMDLVRPGIIIYGLWPSDKTKINAKKMRLNITLYPVLSWKTRIAQIKIARLGEFVGYGCTYQTKRKSKLALLPVGYYDGYDRSGLSNNGYVLVRGKKAPICGRIHMNTMVVDVTDIPGVKLEDTVTLLGKDGHQEITAEDLAERCGTINYEFTTRINGTIPRIVV